MAVFRFIALAAASLALVRAEDSNPTATDAQACITKMNEARREVGFEDLKVASGHPHISTTSGSHDAPGKIKLTTMCKILRGQEPEQDDFKDTNKAEGAIGYHKQDGTGQDCDAAVQYWKGGYSKFNHTLPPAPTFSGDPVVLGDAPYNTPEASGFIALYNPSVGANAQCVYLTCPAQNADTMRTGSSTTPEAKAVVCITNPNPFKGNKAPFTEDQWKQITDVFNPNSANVAAPTFVALAAAALGLAFF